MIFTIQWKAFVFQFLKFVVVCILGAVYAQIQYVWKYFYPPIDLLMLILVVFVMLRWQCKNSRKMNLYWNIIYGLLVVILFSISNNLFYIYRIL